ncbi:MAG: thiosulfate oxidation carrier protein SoxY [Deltaproteobacteria bacterium]|nr:thiosulfate oxidation carrier protein SoxY [Deltaproteobacteria bacterium]
MNATRREILSYAAAALAALAAGLSGLLPVRSARAANGTQLAIALFTKGALPLEGGVRIEAPEIADNGGAVPVRVSAEGARRIALFADGNPSPGVAVFTFGQWVTPTASTRIRLAGSQKLVAVAEMADGTFRTTFRAIKVTAGGC